MRTDLIVTGVVVLFANHAQLISQTGKRKQIGTVCADCPTFKASPVRKNAPLHPPRLWAYQLLGEADITTFLGKNSTHLVLVMRESLS